MLVDGAHAPHQIRDDAVDGGAQILAREGNDRLPHQRRRHPRMRDRRDEVELFLILPDAANLGARLQAAQLHGGSGIGLEHGLRARVAIFVVDRDMRESCPRAA